MKQESEFQAYYNQFRTFSHFDAKEERKLLRKIKKGDIAARDLFITHNMRLVLSCVLRFVDSNDAKAMDLVSAGTLGLMKAIDDFKVSKKNRFSTYAVWWIQARIRKELHAIQPKIHQHKVLHTKYRAMAKQLHLQNGQRPSQEEVFIALEWDDTTIIQYLEDSERQIIPLENIETASEMGQLKNDPLIIDEDRAVFDEMLENETSQKLSEALAKLPPELEDIIRRHYGLGYQDTETYDDLAQFYRFTRERIRQLENDGLRKLWVALKNEPLLADHND
jgi:RNA polymerase primary sigma factor